MTNNLINGGMSGDVTSESRNVSDFSRVELSGSGDLVIDQTGRESLEIEADENLIDRIETRVIGDTLRIDLKGPRFIWPFWSSNRIKYRLSVDELDHLTIAGSGSVKAKNLKADSLELNILGSGEGDMSMDVRKLDVNISGSGEFILSGKARGQELTISGSGDYDAKELKSKTADVQITGSGEGIVNATDKLDVSIERQRRPSVSGAALNQSKNIRLRGHLQILTCLFLSNQICGQIKTMLWS